MAEWLKAAVLKTVSRKRDVGSNPTPSAKYLPEKGIPKTFCATHEFEIFALIRCVRFAGVTVKGSMG